MFALGGDAFPNDSQSLIVALNRGASAHGAGENAVVLGGNFPSLETLRMNLTGVRLDSRMPAAKITENAAGGFFARALEVTAEPATAAGIPIQLRVQAQDCVFTFGTTADGTRAARLETCAGGTFDAEAATTDIESALLALARDAASKHGAEVQSVLVTFETENPRQIAVTAVAVAKAMFFTATLTIRGRLALDEELNLRLTDATCTGDGMIANLAASQLRPRLAELESRAFSIGSVLPAGLRATDIAMSGGASLRIRATFGAK